jgi:hypothetical protein
MDFASQLKSQLNLSLGICTVLKFLLFVVGGTAAAD